MSRINKFISDVGVTFIASIISTILALPVSMILGKFLGADDLGLYRMLDTIIGITILFAAVGIHSAINKYTAEFRDDKVKSSQIISSGIISSIFLGIASFFIIYFSADLFANIFNMPRLSELIKIMAFSYPFILMNNVLLGVFYGRREMNKTSLVTVLQSASNLIFIFLLIFNYGVKGAVLGTLFSYVITTLILIFLHGNINISWNNYFNTSKMLVSFGSKTFLSNAINLLNYKADILMIGYFLTEKDVGIYSVAVMFATVVWILPNSIQQVTYPLISEYHAKKKKDDIIFVIDKSMKYSFLFLIFSSTFFIFFGQLIIQLLFGADFLSSIPSLYILLIGTIFFGSTKSIGSVFASIGKLDLVYKIPLSSAIINLILNAYLIPIYGIEGGAIATSVSLIVSMILIIYYMKILLGFKFDYSWYFKVFITTLFILCLYNFLNKSIDSILIEPIFYFSEVFLLLLAYLSAEDKAKLFNLIGNLKQNV